MSVSGAARRVAPENGMTHGRCAGPSLPDAAERRTRRDLIRRVHVQLGTRRDGGGPAELPSFVLAALCAAVVGGTYLLGLVVLRAPERLLVGETLRTLRRR